MTVEAQLHDGRILEFPDGTDPAVVQATVKKVLGQESSISGEFGKGLGRGASNIGLGISNVATNLLGPVVGPLAQRGIETLAAPSRELVRAAPADKLQQFAGTAGEIAGGGIAGGGAGSVRGALTTAGSALGAASGEQVGGPIGLMLGSIAGSYGMSAAVTIGKKLGMTLADVMALIGSGFGSKRGTERLASKFVTERAGEAAPEAKKILTTPTEEIAGVKPTAGEVLTGAQAARPDQMGGGLIRLQRDLYGARGVEDVLPTTAKQQETAISRHFEELKKTTGPMRETALDAANQVGGVKVGPLIENIRKLSAEPGKRASEVISKSLEETVEKIGKHIETGGRIDARDLYTIRKEVGNTIEKFAKESANWDKRLTGGLQREAQKLIDDAIEASGGTGWKKYLATESRGRQLVDDFRERQKEMRLIQTKTKGGPVAAIAQGEVPQAPTLLHRGMMLLNYGLKMIGQDANDPIVKRVATAMQNPEELAKLIKLPLNHPERRAMTTIVNSLAATDVLPKAKQQLLQATQ